VISAFASFEIIDRVNEKLRSRENFGWLGWYPFKYGDFIVNTKDFIRMGAS
jgi:hypothetical protein